MTIKAVEDYAGWKGLVMQGSRVIAIVPDLLERYPTEQDALRGADARRNQGFVYERSIKDEEEMARWQDAENADAWRASQRKPEQPVVRREVNPMAVSTFVDRWEYPRWEDERWEELRDRDD